MFQLLKIEWLKIKYYRTFWILSILYLLSIVGINYIVYRVQQNIYSTQQSKGLATLFVGNPPYSFPMVWQMTCYVSSFLLFIPGLLMIISITNEYSFKTHRQNIIDGWSRTEFISVKLVLATIVSIVSTLAVLFTAILFGVAEGSHSLSFESIEFIGFFFIQCISYTSLALLFGVLFKRSGIAIGVYFLYTLVIENLFAGLLNRYADFSGRFLPLETTDNLIPFPFFKSIKKQFIPEANIAVLLCLSAVYLIIYFYISKKKFETDDL